MAAASLLSGCVVVGGSGSSSNRSGFMFLLLPLVVLGLFGMMRARGRDRHPQWFSDNGHAAAASEPSLNMLRAELSVLADDVLRLEPQITLKPEARDDYEAALHRYRVAQAALEDTDARIDVFRVQRVVDEASWLMARARARLDGREPPGPPASLRRPGQTGEPALKLEPGDHPRYVGSHESFETGWFSVGPGLFGGLLIGSILGSGFGDGNSEEIDYPDDDSGWTGE